MFCFTIILTIFSVFQLSQSIRIDFTTIPICTTSDYWCVRAFHLQYNLLTYDNLGITDKVCFHGTESQVFRYTAYMDKSDLPLYRFKFELYVGFRHNCTSDHKLVDWIAKEQFVDDDAPYANIMTVKDIYDKGERIDWDKLDKNWSWFRGSFGNCGIERKKYYTNE